MFGMKKRFDKRQTLVRERKRYCTADRKPFYALAEEYLPTDPMSAIVDIGAGDGGFIETLHISAKYANVTLLDANPDNVAQLRTRYPSVILYRAPERLPFDDASVDYVHCSHMIEHLPPQDLYRLMYEVDRILKEGGVINISTPLLWEKFYNDLSHVRPYNPEILLAYLCATNLRRVSTAGHISRGYEHQRTVFRYVSEPVLGEVGSNIAIVDCLVRAISRFLHNRAQVCVFRKNGYTVFLRKGASQSMKAESTPSGQSRGNVEC